MSDGLVDEERVTEPVREHAEAWTDRAPDHQIEIAGPRVVDE